MKRGGPLLLCACTVATACGAIDPCADRIIAEMPSPTGAVRVVVFERDCGATTGFSTQVSVLPRGETFHPTPNSLTSSSQANCFTCDSGHGQAAEGPGGGPWVAARWLSPTEVEIRYDQRARVFRRETSVRGVSVRYLPVPTSSAPRGRG